YASRYLCVFNAHTCHLHVASFPTRRSADLQATQQREYPVESGGRRGRRLPRLAQRDLRGVEGRGEHPGLPGHTVQRGGQGVDRRDRKSTRLNSSHVKISYAVSCLKKKRKET